MAWELAPDLAGTWRVVRNIPRHGRFTGSAEVGALGDGRFHWRELGELRLIGGDSLRAYRSYVYALNAEARVIEIHYADGPSKGELMHRFEFAGRTAARHVHTCRPDTYVAKLRLLGSDRFQLSHAVSGPRKAYRMSTILYKTRGDTL